MWGKKSTLLIVGTLLESFLDIKCVTCTISLNLPLFWICSCAILVCCKFEEDEEERKELVNAYVTNEKEGNNDRAADRTLPSNNASNTYDSSFSNFLEWPHGTFSSDDVNRTVRESDEFHQYIVTDIVVVHCLCNYTENDRSISISQQSFYQFGIAEITKTTSRVPRKPTVKLLLAEKSSLGHIIILHFRPFRICLIGIFVHLINQFTPP